MEKRGQLGGYSPFTCKKKRKRKYKIVEKKRYSILFYLRLRVRACVEACVCGGGGVGGSVCVRA